MKIHIIMTTRNRRELTLECLAAIYRQTFKDYEVTVVDDGSTDGTPAAIRERFPAVKVILGDGNLWWSAGMNVGLSNIMARASETDYVLTLNDDSWFEPDYLAELAAAAAQNPGACVGSLVRNYYQKEVIEDSGVLVEWDGFLFKQRPFNGQDSLAPVDTLSGRGTLVPATVFKKIGFFNQKSLPHYGADYEFFLRAARHGVPLFMSYAATVFDVEKLGEKVQKRSLFWRMFNRKSPSNLRTTYFLLWHYSPSFSLKIKNFFAYTLRALKKI